MHRFNSGNHTLESIKQAFINFYSILLWNCPTHMIMRLHSSMAPCFFLAFMVHYYYIHHRSQDFFFHLLNRRAVPPGWRRSRDPPLWRSGLFRWVGDAAAPPVAFAERRGWGAHFLNVISFFQHKLHRSTIIFYNEDSSPLTSPRQWHVELYYRFNRKCVE